MALDTYTGLKSLVADFLNRDDLTAQIPDFITLCEAKIARKVRRKTIRNDAFAIAAEATTLPADCAELRYVLPLTGSPARDQPLKVATPAMLADWRSLTSGVSDVPRVFTVIDDKLLVAPPPSQSCTYRVIYFQKLVPLSGSNASNTVLAEAPDIYLYGTLAEAAPYLEHDERLALWKGLFEEAIDDLNDKRQREETAAFLSAARLPTVF